MEPTRRNTTLSGKRAGLPFKDDLPTISVTPLRRSGAITPHSKSVQIFDGCEVRVTHRLFPARGPLGKRGSWSFFLCPSCERRVRNLSLYDGRIVCRWCHGLLYRCQTHDRGDTIARLRQALYGPNPPRLRRHLEIALRRALLAERRKWL